ncbi:hypothetical protein [Nonomuraea sp. NPDC003754]
MRLTAIGLPRSSRTRAATHARLVLRGIEASEDAAERHGHLVTGMEALVWQGELHGIPEESSSAIPYFI